MKNLLWIGLCCLVVVIGLIYYSLSSTDAYFSTCDIVGVEDLDDIDFAHHDSVLITASTVYEGNPIKELIQGQHYREAWSTPVLAPVVFLDTLLGGLEIVEEGGGMQTHSLDVRSPDGIIYSLRSVNKDPSQVIPEFAKSLGLENIVVDGISAQHPYGALLAAALADSAGILHTHPRLMFVPKQDILDTLNAKYGNRLFFLEYESEGEVNWTGFENVVELIDTEDLVEWKFVDKKPVSIDERALVRARLFDLIIGDWDRHAKQWGWVIREQNQRLIAIPIPADRDNAFYNVGGLIPSIITDPSVHPKMRPFSKVIDYLPGLVRDFDTYFLLKTDRAIFEEEARALKASLSDEAIEGAMMSLSAAHRKLHGEQISSTLKARRDEIVDYAIEFRALLDQREPLDQMLKQVDDVTLTPEQSGCFVCADQ